jgi:hypothetical protein
MAFQPGNAQNESKNDSWKADGFLNLFLPNNEGKLKKLGAIPLKGSKPNEKTLAAWLTEDPTRVEKILAKLVIQYQPNVADTTGFKLD